jgi:hypothetical protein
MTTTQLVSGSKLSSLQPSGRLSSSSHSVSSLCASHQHLTANIALHSASECLLHLSANIVLHSELKLALRPHPANIGGWSLLSAACERTSHLSANFAGGDVHMTVTKVSIEEKKHACKVLMHERRFNLFRVIERTKPWSVVQACKRLTCMRRMAIVLGVRPEVIGSSTLHTSPYDLQTEGQSYNDECLSQYASFRMADK